MPDDPLLWLEVYGGYAAISAVLLALLHRRDPKAWTVRFVIAAAMPIAGLLIAGPRSAGKNARGGKADSLGRAEFSGGLALPEGAFLTADLKVPEDDIRLHLERAKNARARDAVPLEEALLVADVPIRRRMLLSLLGRETPIDPELLALAVRNDDTETSHYAVSVVLERRRKGTLAVQEWSARYEEDPSDPGVMRAYAAALKEYLAGGFLDPASRRDVRLKLAEVLQRLVHADPDACRYYPDLIDTELELRRCDRAAEAAEEFVRRFPDREEAYLALLKTGYARRSKEAVRDALNRLIAAPVRLSGDALATVRFWLGGADDPVAASRQ